MELFPADARLLLLFDGLCPLCRRSVAWLRQRDRRHALHCLPLQTEGVLDALGIPLADAMGRMQAVSRDGERRQGADGVLWAVAQLPGWGWIRLLHSIPGAMPVARAIYRQIARRRAREECDGYSCSLH